MITVVLLVRLAAVVSAYTLALPILPHSILRHALTDPHVVFNAECPI